MGDSKELIAIVMSIAFGTFTILASIFNWNFFFENRKASFFVNLFGRKGSRIFYAALGILLFFLAYKMISEQQM